MISRKLEDIVPTVSTDQTTVKITTITLMAIVLIGTIYHCYKSYTQNNNEKHPLLPLNNSHPT